jgi:hypothetical protein
MNHNAAVRVAYIILPLFAATFVIGGCAHPLQCNLDAYRAAKKRGDYETAGKYLDPDARIWFEKKEGDGHPLRAKGGPWAEWDRYFNAESTREQERVEGRTVTYISRETNDFYRLIERESTPARVTCYFDDDGKITGMLYAGLSDDRPPDRMDAFKAWAAEHYPGQLERIAPGGKINPALENARRWKKLLAEWRADAGLPPVDG